MNKRDQETFADRLEQQIERFAPAFRDSIIARTVTAPPQFTRHSANLVVGPPRRRRTRGMRRERRAEWFSAGNQPFAVATKRYAIGR